MSDKEAASRVCKLLKNGALYPEDLTQNDIRLLRQHRPRVYHYMKGWLEYRQERIENGEWSVDAEPPETDRRINRLDNGKSAVEPYEPEGSDADDS